MSNKELANQTVANLIKILSAIFDEQGGQITVSRETFNNAKFDYHLKTKIEDDEITFFKIDGQS